MSIATLDSNVQSMTRSFGILLYVEPNPLLPTFPMKLSPFHLQNPPLRRQPYLLFPNQHPLSHSTTGQNTLSASNTLPQSPITLSLISPSSFPLPTSSQSSSTNPAISFTKPTNSPLVQLGINSFLKAPPSRSRSLSSDVDGEKEEA
jgi:hypothetical protein